MKVLFVCSGNSKFFDIVPFIKSQGSSLENAGVEVNYFRVKGKGIWGYLKSGIQLRKYIKKHPHDIIHAHFTLSGWAALLGAGKTPIVLSLMGSDAYGDHVTSIAVRAKSIFFKLLTLMIQPFVDVIISKSQNIENKVYLKHKSHIVPNGVNTSVFKPYLKDCREELGLDKGKRYVLFLGNRNKPIKNYKLASDAVSALGNQDICLINPYPLSHDEVPKYLNSVDVLVLPSFMEGSPNVVKEAMACNCPIVATDVGDVKWVMGDMEGCHMAGFTTDDFAEKVRSALVYADQFGRTSGFERIRALGLDEENIAQRLIAIYKKALNGQPVYLHKELEVNAATSA